MQHPRATAIAAVVLCAALAVAGSASAHVGQPTLTAQHAFVGDPLWGLDSAEGTLLGVLPDERTAQASTTKLMTLHLTVLALNAGEVSLSDQVTINATEAAVGGSTMADINGVSLEAGEVVSLETLIRGMMYPSGNNAAWAIGRHVAEAYLGVGADAADFVAMMNQHALDRRARRHAVHEPERVRRSIRGGRHARTGRVQPLHHRARAREEHRARDPGSVLPAGRRVPGDVHRHDHGRAERHEDVLVELGLQLPRLGGRQGRRDAELQRPEQRLHGDERGTDRQARRARVHAGSAVGRRKPACSTSGSRPSSTPTRAARACRSRASNARRSTASPESVPSRPR